MKQTLMTANRSPHLRSPHRLATRRLVTRSLATRSAVATLLLGCASLVGCSSEVGEPDSMGDGVGPAGSGTVTPAGMDVYDAMGNRIGVSDGMGNVVDDMGNVVGSVGDTTGSPAMTGGAASGTAGTGAEPGTANTSAGDGSGDPPAVGGGRTPVDCSSVQVPATSQIPRLTNAQYNRTVFDLVGAIAPGLLAIEQQGDITNSIWNGYKLSAERIAADVMADETMRSNFVTCTPVDDGAACLSQIITEFGRKAFRRPLTPDEVAGFEDLVAQRNEITATGSFDEIAEVLLSAFLMSPSFLMRAEIAEQPGADGTFTLTSHEVASRMSYMLWGSMPDEELSAAADADQLTTKEQVLTHARRMAADPKARDVAADVHREYLHLYAGSRWDSAAKDSQTFPLFTPEAVPDMIVETEMLFDKVYSSGGSFQDLLTTTKAYVTENTAALYGLDPSMYGPTPTEVDLDSSMRAGFLTRVGFLASHSPQTRTSPIIRGAYIMKDVLGIDPGPPDPNVANEPLPNAPDLDTNRKRVTQQTSAIACAGCHENIINPPGFVMEAFDASGVEQTTEASTGAPIDATATVIFDRSEPAGVLISTPGELAQNIAASASAQRHYAARWVGYAYARDLTDADECTAEMLGSKVTAGGYSIQELLADLTQTDHFLTRATN